MMDKPNTTEIQETTKQQELMLDHLKRLQELAKDEVKNGDLKKAKMLLQQAQTYFHYLSLGSGGQWPKEIA